MKSELIFVSLRWVDVLSTYTLIASTGQHAEFGRLGITIDCSGPLYCAFLGFKSTNGGQFLNSQQRSQSQQHDGFQVKTEIARLRFSPNDDN
ncbi:hypothetical protein GHT06_019101 [Daphnia sinensis]|uniref:Uncharacterized protein n=1 Tax=Daphnia sinensis TaxID=1820382 RepID=A0AAD5PNZ7_9CRUS|nr:hypothetical protein GHT06_019101 [Daphnia sinensis]